MSPLTSLFVSCVVLLSSLSFAQVRGEVVIQSRDGKAVVGRVITETAKGYLIATATGTKVIEFADVADVRQLVPAVSAAPVVAPVAPVPVAASPVVAVTPVPSSPAEWSEVPPPPPALPPAPAAEVASSSSVERPRSSGGVRFGLGVGLGTHLFEGYVSPSAAVQGMLEVGSRAAYRLVVNAELASPAGAIVAVDNLFVYSIGSVFAFGAGLEIGASISTLSYFQLSAVLQPAILKFGQRGQHQVQLTLALTVLSSVQYVPTWDHFTKSFYLRDESVLGTLRSHVGYTYVF